MFERQKPSKDKVILLLSANKTLLKTEMIFANPVIKCYVAPQISVFTWLTGLCVNVRKTGRLSDCIWVVGYFRKENLKDEKGIRENQ